MNINWYPGHMLKTKREITEDIKLIDVVIEILDARAPLASQNPDIAKIIGNKKHIILLNKSDLAEEFWNDKWIEYFKNNNATAILVNSNLGKGIEIVIKQIKKDTEEEVIKAKGKGIAEKRIRAIVLRNTECG